MMKVVEEEQREGTDGEQEQMTQSQDTLGGAALASSSYNVNRRSGYRFL